jgi:hypothetical protein
MAAQNLFQSYMQPVRSVADYEGDLQQQDMRRLQIQGAERNNAMAALAQRQQMQGMERNALVQAAQRAAAERAAGDEGAYGRNMRLSGLPELIDQADKIDKAATERGKAKSENAKRDTETENNVIAMWRDMIGGAVDQQQAAQMFTAMRADPRIQNTPVAQVPLELGLRSLSEKPLDQWKKEFALGATKYVEMNKPTYQQQNLGGTMQTLALPGLGGAPTVAAAAPITQSADNAATQATARANQARMSADAAAGRAQSAAQFNQRLAFDKDKEKATAAGGPSKPLPSGALKMQQESLDAIGISSSINADLGGIQRQIEGGKLSFGPVSNLTNAARNMAGVSSEESRNFASFKSTLERLRNESLRLNSGVQTDGDAQRAWNELFQNINDTDLVKQRLAEIQGINKRGSQLHQLRVDSIRSNYNAGPLDASAYKEQHAAVGAAPSAVKSGTDLGGGFRVK